MYCLTAGTHSMLTARTHHPPSDEACSQYKQAREYMKNNPNVDNNSHHGLFGS